MQDHLDMETVTLELGEEELDAVDEIAFRDHRDNREAAIRELLDRWLKERDGENGGGGADGENGVDGGDSGNAENGI